MKTEILLPDANGLALAAAEIKRGGLVAFATETVYGLGADAFNPLAIAKIYVVKGRPNDNPLIVHLSSVEDISRVGQLPQKALKAVSRFMPGALTIVINKNADVPSEVTGGLNTVAVRIPALKSARDFIAVCGTPLAAPSANTSTRPSPTTAAHVYGDLNGKIAYILDGGACEIGLESTILDFSTDKIRLLRRGGIPLERLEEALGEIEIYQPTGDRPLSPGMKYRHYAPTARVVLFEHNKTEEIMCEYKRLTGLGQAVRVLLVSGILKDNLLKNSLVKDNSLSNTLIKGNSLKGDSLKGDSLKDNQLKDNFLSNTKDILVTDFVSFDCDEEYAKRLFFELRRADEDKKDAILCEMCGDNGIGQSINSRLLKAAGGSING